MKIRRGFVSNSSSCSFVVIGYKMPKDYSFIEEIIENIYPDDWKKYKEEYFKKGDNIIDHWCDFCGDKSIVLLDDEEKGYCSNDNMIIGKTISETNDVYIMDETVVFIKDLEKDISEIGSVLENHGIERNTVLITGTKMC